MNLQELVSKLRTIEEGKPLAPVHTDGPAEAEGIIIGNPMGGMMGGMGHSEPPKQQDNVDMNITIHGAGAGGVRDLMNILHNIETGNSDSHDHADHDHQEPIMGDMVRAMADEQIAPPDQDLEEVMDDDSQTWGNSAYGDSGHHTHGIDSVTMHGDDMNSKGGPEPTKKQGGGNPYNESLVNRLSQLYQQIKEERTEEKDEKGNVVRWKEETPWRKASGKDGRGKVTNMSDKARRESEKLSKKEVAEASENRTMSRAAKGNEKYGKDGMKALAKAGREGKDLDKIRDKYNKYD